MHSEIPLIILTGHRKSGTTMFHRLFDGIEKINLYPTDFSLLYAYFPCFTSRENLHDEDLRQRLLLVVEKSIRHVFQVDDSFTAEKQAFLQYVRNRIEGIDLRDKGDVIRAIWGAWSDFKGVEDPNIPFVIKETSQAVYFDAFRETFPRLKMISLVRDPRDNFAAIHAGVEKYYSKFGEGAFTALGSLINRARMDLIAACLHQKNHPESFLAIRFEDLVSEPEKIMAQVASFLEIDFDERLLIPEINGSVYAGNCFDDKVFSGISSRNVGSWKSRISESSAKVIEYWLGDVMQDWGYAREFSEMESQSEFAKFYELYNCKHFYHDSFSG